MDIASSILADGGALADPIDDQICDLKIILVDHHQVVVALDPLLRLSRLDADGRHHRRPAREFLADELRGLFWP
jgi:hypothetical protein